MTRSILASCCAAGAMLAVLAAPAFAQAPPAASTAPFLPAPKLAQSHIEVATDVIRLSGMARSIDLIVPQMIESARRMFTQMRPELAGDVDKSIKNLDPEWTLQHNLAIRIAAEAFAEKLNEAELKQLQAFFSSDAGKKFVAVQPSLLPDMMRNLDAFTSKLSLVVIEKIREDFKKRNVPF